MRSLLRLILDAGPLGWIVLASNALAALAALLLAARSIETRPRRPLRTLAKTLGVTCTGIAVAAVTTAALFARAGALIAPPGERPLSVYRATGHELRDLVDTSLHAEASLSLTAHVTLGAAVLVILAALIARVASHRKLRARRLLAWSAALAGAELAGSIAIGVLRRAREVDVGPHCPAECRRAIAADITQILEGARLHIALAAAVAFFLLTRAIRRSDAAGHAPFGPRAKALCLALFGLGVSAFAATRAMASDATRPFPAQNFDEICPSPRIDERALPPAGTATTLAQGTLIKLSAKSAEFNEQPVENPDDLTKRMIAMRSLWRQIQPDRPMPPPLLAAPASEPVAALAPWLQALLREGFHEAHILVAHPPDFEETATLGRIERAPRCASIPVNLEPIEQAIARGATWGELAANVSPR